MPFRSKPEETKFSAAILVRVTPQMKKDMDAIGDETGISISERARTCFQATIDEWKKKKAQ